MNLNELWHYDDPVDQWAAELEFKLRKRRYERALEGIIGVTRRFIKATEELRDAFGGIA
jgi:hypothetical protein